MVEVALRLLKHSPNHTTASTWFWAGVCLSGKNQEGGGGPCTSGPCLALESTRGLSLLLPPLLSFAFVPLLTLRSACPCLPPSSFPGAACLFGYILRLCKDREFLAGFLGLVPAWGGSENKPGAIYKWEAWRSHRAIPFRPVTEQHHFHRCKKKFFSAYTENHFFNDLKEWNNSVYKHHLQEFRAHCYWEKHLLLMLHVGGRKRREKLIQVLPTSKLCVCP